MSFRRYVIGLVSDACYLASFLLSAWYAWWAYLAVAGIALGLINFRVLLAHPQLARNSLVYPLSLLFPVTSALWLRSPRSQPEELVPDRRKHLLRRRVGLLLVLVGALTLTVTDTLGRQVVNPALAPADEAAAIYLKDTLFKATIAYASARGTDRLISLMSETEFSGGIGVVSVSGKPGQILKPLQDVLERFSELMLWAMSSLMIQLFMLELGVVVAIPIVLSVFIVLVIAAECVGQSHLRQRILALARVVIVAAIVLRLLIPIVSMGVAGVSSAVLETHRVEAQVAVEEGAAYLEQAVNAEDDDASFLDRVRQTADGLKAAVYGAGTFAEKMVKEYITLFVIFLVQTVVAPIAVLFLLWRLGSAALKNSHINDGLRGLQDLQLSRKESPRLSRYDQPEDES